MLSGEIALKNNHYYYTMFLVNQFPSNGHLFFSLQLHDVSTFFSMLLSVILLLWMLIICSMFLVQL